jgi:hypothetical protein
MRWLGFFLGILLVQYYVEGAAKMGWDGMRIRESESEFKSSSRLLAMACIYLLDVRASACGHALCNPQLPRHYGGVHQKCLKSTSTSHPLVVI